jgi:hypothetical protein
MDKVAVKKFKQAKTIAYALNAIVIAALGGHLARDLE